MSTVRKREFLLAQGTASGDLERSRHYKALHPLRINDSVEFCDARPLHPPVIEGVEILWNPFDDIEPRSTRPEREAAAERCPNALKPSTLSLMHIWFRL